MNSMRSTTVDKMDDLWLSPHTDQIVQEQKRLWTKVPLYLRQQ